MTPNNPAITLDLTTVVMSGSHEQILQEFILKDTQFVMAIFQGARRGTVVTWPRVTIRPLFLQDIRYLQFTYFNGTQDVAKNFRDEQAEDHLRELLASPFKSIQAESAGETIRVQFSKKGRPIVHRERRMQSISIGLAHDRVKSGILAEDQPAPFLEAIGVATTDGRIRASQQRKFRQINEFLRLIEDTGEVERLESRPVHVVDLGCGSAALTFATYHYLNTVKGITSTMVGVDTKARLLDRHRETVAQLGWEGMDFEAARIVDYEAAEAPDIVLALHACDTATDEALARAVRWRSKLIFSAPCCHHHLQSQLSAGDTPEPFRPVLRHGILRERLGDILTDSFRAHILRMIGYRTDVMEFVAVEHTPKNLMIRAVDTHAPPSPALIAEYRSLKDFWGITPYLEQLLKDELYPILDDARK